MPLDIAHYHPWQGELRSPWWSTVAIVRTALMQVFRRKAYWFVLALGALNFVLFFSIIYAITQLDIDPRARSRLYEATGFEAEPAAGQESGYIRFMDRQSVVVMLLLAFTGSLLIGDDFRNGALAFYLSRRIDRVHYLAGKFLAVAALVSLVTTLPALLLYVEFGMFTSSLDYWITHWDLLGAILAYGLVQCFFLSVMIVSLSAYLQRTAPIAITWASGFVLLGRLASFLHDSSGNLYWKLLDPWKDLREVGRLVFGEFGGQGEQNFAWTALAVLLTLAAVGIVSLSVKLRSVEVVP